MGQTMLMHYGVKGMKWGVRRSEAELARARGRSSSSDSGKPSSGRKRVSEMSDDELRKSVNRLQLEQQYNKLNPEKISVGKRFVNKMLKDVVVPAATEVAKESVKKIMQSSADALINKTKKK